MIHKHCFGEGLFDLMVKLCMKFKPNQPFHPQKNIELTKNQYNNTQKLRYWGVLEKYYEDGKRKGGYWYLTDRARKILQGDPVPKWVKTFNNEVKSVSEEKYDIAEVAWGYALPKEWSERAEMLGDNLQESFDFQGGDV